MILKDLHTQLYYDINIKYILGYMIVENFRMLCESQTI